MEGKPTNAPRVRPSEDIPPPSMRQAPVVEEGVADAADVVTRDKQQGLREKFRQEATIEDLKIELEELQRENSLIRESEEKIKDKYIRLKARMKGLKRKNETLKRENETLRQVNSDLGDKLKQSEQSLKITAAAAESFRDQLETKVQKMVRPPSGGGGGGGAGARRKKQKKVKKTRKKTKGKTKKKTKGKKKKKTKKTKNIFSRMLDSIHLENK